MIKVEFSARPVYGFFIERDRVVQLVAGTNLIEDEDFEVIKDTSAYKWFESNGLAVASDYEKPEPKAPKTKKTKKKE